MSGRILLVEDEPGLVLTLTDRLSSEGYDVASALDGPAGLARATSEKWDLILLDVMLPGMNGFDVVKEIRQKKVTAPVIMLTARGQVVDKVLGLKLGADDYLTKPFETLELLARIEAQIRRAAAASTPGAPIYQFGDIAMDVRKAEVRRGGKIIDLSAREFLLLKYFVEHREAFRRPVLEEQHTSLSVAREGEHVAILEARTNVGGLREQRAGGGRVVGAHPHERFGAKQKSALGAVDPAFVDEPPGARDPSSRL